MFRYIVNNTAFNAKLLNLNNPAKWSCIGYSKKGIGQSFYIPQIDTMINTGVQLVSGNNVTNYLYPKNLLITQNTVENNRFIDNHINPKNILCHDLTNMSNKYIQVDNEETYSLDNISVATHLLNNNIPSYGYGITYNNEKQLMIMGNTSINAFYSFNEWKEYPVIIVDCANYCNYPTNISRYHNDYYISWKDLVPIVTQYTNIKFILTNSDTNINTDDISYINKIIKYSFNNYNIDNVYPWID